MTTKRYAGTLGTVNSTYLAALACLSLMHVFDLPQLAQRIARFDELLNTFVLELGGAELKA
ncbi:MAG: hypothetical protein ACE5NW_16550 [Acidiferrobacterales bacterium]